ncbi:MAG: serine/threonine-protein kinase [Planctomycetota bacterium]
MTTDDLEPPPLPHERARRAEEAPDAPDHPHPGDREDGDPQPGGITEEQLWSWVDRDAPELAGHLERFPEDRGRVDGLRRAIRAVASSGPDRVPERIGRYPIVGRLGSGGMGVVFEAQQLEPSRRVALKVIRGAWLDDDRTRRLFRRESEVLARLQHPGIAQIFDAGETKEGAPFFVMELVRGRTLDAWAAGKGRDEKLRVLAEVARAVDHAHEKGVIHRDLKPSNVLVTTEGRAKVLDFGLARIVDPTATASLTAAMSGKVIGTVRYMSPEQAAGHASRVTPASDVYSLGVLAYELLVGRSPHDLEDKGFLECARTVAEKDVTLPSVHRPGIESDLERVLCEALARDPGRRYVSARELASDFDAVREGRAVTAGPTGGRRGSAAPELGKVARDAANELGRAARAVADELRGAFGAFTGKTAEDRRRARIRRSRRSRLGAGATRISHLLAHARAKAQFGARAARDGARRARAATESARQATQKKPLRVDLNPALDALGSASSEVRRAGATGAASAKRGVGRVRSWWSGVWERRRAIAKKRSLFTRVWFAMPFVLLLWFNLCLLVEGGDVADAFEAFVAPLFALVRLVEDVLREIL